MNHYRKIDFTYDCLDGKAQELYNQGILSGLLIHQGYYVMPLPHDSDGADFIAIPLTPHHVSQEIHIQLKSRPSTDPKYLAKGIKIAFPNDGEWFILDYDEWHEYITSNFSAGDHCPWSSEKLGRRHLESLRQMALFDFYSSDPSSSSINSSKKQTRLTPTIV